MTLPADPTAVSVDESEIAASYEQQKANFVTEEQVRVDYVELDREDFARPDEVSAAEIQSAYQQLVDGFKSQEERSALLTTGGATVASARWRARTPPRSARPGAISERNNFV